jgi:uncharacterized Zn finger protein
MITLLPPPVRCPRCRSNKDLVRGTLTNDSAALPIEKRGRKKAKRVTVHCNRCGYTWRSVSPAVVALKEDTNAIVRVRKEGSLHWAEHTLDANIGDLEDAH